MMTLTRANGTNFWQFLEEQGISYQQSDFPFLNSDAAIQPVLKLSEITQMTTASQVIGYLYQKLGNSFSYITPILDNDFKAGFNDHSDRHTLWIALQTAELLSRSGRRYDGNGAYDTQSEVMAAFVGMMHDFGILKDRKNHSTYSIELLEQLTLDYHEYPEVWKAVIQAISSHEEPTLIEQGIKLDQLTPLDWSLIIADKIHYGRDRVSPKMLSNPFEQDLHLLVNAMIARSMWYLEADTFVYHIDFSIRELADRFQNYTHGKDRLWVPDSIYQKYADGDQPYRDSFIELFTQLYQPRMDIATKAAFLLYPWINTFSVNLSDTDSATKVGSTLVPVFSVHR